jgi:CheY-like chemotaxis protein
MKTVLIVDDEKHICEDIKSELEYLGNNQVFTSGTIPEAINVINTTENLHYAIIDLKLDNTAAYGGMKIYAYLKKNKPDVKIVIISGFAFKDIKGGLVKELSRENLPENEIDVIERCYVYKGGTEDYIDAILRKLKLSSRWYGNYHALLIAVQEYESPTTKDLRYPKKDIKRLENTLKNEYEFDTVRPLINPKRQEIVRTLYKLAEELSVENNLLIFYAGHGHRDEKVKAANMKKNGEPDALKGIGYWVPSNATFDDPSEWLSHSDIRDLISRIDTQHTLLISDACFSGTFLELGERGKLEKLDEENAKRIYNCSSRRVLTSGNAKEKVPDNSFFLEFFINCLKNNKEKYLPTRLIHERISKPVNTESGKQQMYGKLPGTGDEEDGEFIFIRKS